MAQWIAHLTSNQGVAGSSPAVGISFFLTAIKNFNWINIIGKSGEEKRLFARVGLRGRT